MRTRRLKAQSDALRRVVAAFALSFLIWAPASQAADLQATTSAAFDRYAQLTQAKFEAQNSVHNPFLWIDMLPAQRRDVAYQQLKSGQVVIEKLETDDDGKTIAVPAAMIHHWVGTVFIPGATLAQVLAFEQDYDHQAPYFQPDVVSSKVLSHSGPDFKIRLRIYKRKVISVVLDTDHNVHYGIVDANRAWSESQTTRIQEVNHPGELSETLESEGHDNGFLWRMNTYWRFEAKDGGVYVESQSVSLTRDIPAGLGWMVGPFVTSIPRESLEFTLASTRKAVVQQKGSDRK